jgi:hypothetical protein
MTALEIIDSAVKIGLGAAISGIATYYTTIRKISVDRETDHTKSRRELVERLSALVFDYQNNASRAVSWAGSASLAKTEEIKNRLLNNSIENSLLGCDKINMAISIAALIGSSELNNCLMRAAGQMQSLHHILVLGSTDFVAINALLAKMNAIEKEILPMLHQAYEQLPQSRLAPKG